jgi:hypothetical protein
VYFVPVWVFAAYRDKRVVGVFVRFRRRFNTQHKKVYCTTITGMFFLKSVRYFH